MRCSEISRPGGPESTRSRSAQTSTVADRRDSTPPRRVTNDGSRGRRASRLSGHHREQTEIDAGDIRVLSRTEQSIRRLPDGGDRSETETSARDAAGPSWLPTDGTGGRRPDRQILVVGETVVGLALTLLLRRAGYDPLLVSGTDRPAISRVSYLCAPALRILDSIGVGSRLRKRGTRIDGVSVRRSPPAEGGSTVLPRNERSVDTRPVVVGTSDLRRALESELPDRQRRVDRTVGRLARRDDGLAVEFVDGIREWFDVAVDAGGGGASLRHEERDRPEYAVLTQYETLVEADVTSRNRLLDVWHPDGFVQRVPRPNDRGFVLRVTVPRSALATVSNGEHVESVLGGKRLPDEIRDIASEQFESESTAIRQVRLSDGGARREWWGSGRVSFCGSAACPLAPASGFAVSLGIEDAVAFASELERGARPVADVVGSYAADRKRRLTRLRRTTEAEQFDPEYPALRSAESSLASLRTLRQVALGSFLREPMRSVLDEGSR